jgi:hypothetical protein
VQGTTGRVIAGLGFRGWASLHSIIPTVFVVAGLCVTHGPQTSLCTAAGHLVSWSVFNPKAGLRCVCVLADSVADYHHFAESLHIKPQRA